MYNKFSSRKGSCTPWVFPLFSEIFSEDHREDFLNESEFVKGNRLSFVPKTAVIDRSICTEPRWNIYLQLGIGQLIVQRLKKYGLDIECQDRNRELSRLAHVFGLATIDISSASDCVSKNLVLHLLPEEWSDLLFKSRCSFASYEGKDYALEKVSSMGNGYTFALESLIFVALCEATCDFYGEPTLVGVFGDDLIVPNSVSKHLIEVLSYSGFSVNSEKTFLEGNFFESCGKDYFQGVNVRPFFIKERVSTGLGLMVLANQVSEYLRRLPTVGATLRLKKLWDFIVNLIPKKLRLFGPVGMAGVIHAPFDACHPQPASDGWDGWFITTWVPSAVKHWGSSYEGHLFSKLSVDIDTGQFFTNRSNVRWQRKKTYVPTYGDFIWV
jgi:hypothetical protein